MNLVVGGNVQRFLVQWSGSVHIRPPTRHCRIEKSCDSPETNVAIFQVKKSKRKKKKKNEEEELRKECKGVQRKWKGRRKGKKSRFSIISRYRGRISVYHWVQPRILERSSSDAIPDHPTCPISTLVVPRQVGDLFQITQISWINDNDFKRIIINNIIKFDENLLFQSSFEIPAKFVGAHARGQYFRAWGGTHVKRDSVILSFDPVIPPFLFASCTRARKKNIGGTRSDATETLPRGKFRPGWSGKWENAGIIRRGMGRSRDWPDGLSFKSGGARTDLLSKVVAVSLVVTIVSNCCECDAIFKKII